MDPTLKLFVEGLLSQARLSNVAEVIYSDYTVFCTAMGISPLDRPEFTDGLMGIIDQAVERLCQ